MTAQHLELLVEEPSMEAFLRELLPRMLPAECTFKIHPFQGKPDLLGKLQNRLRAYAKWLPDNYRIFVVIDRDNDDCEQLKQKLENIASRTQLLTAHRLLAAHGNWSTVSPLKNWKPGTSATGRQCVMPIRGFHHGFQIKHPIATPMQSVVAHVKLSNAS